MEETENFTSSGAEEAVKAEETEKTTGVEERRDILAEVSKHMGYVETEAAASIRLKLIEPGLDDEIFFSLLGEYRDSQGQPDSEQGEVALLLAVAIIKKEAGRVDLYKEDLNDIANYAFQMMQDDLVALIDQELIEFEL